MSQRIDQAGRGVRAGSRGRAVPALLAVVLLALPMLAGAQAQREQSIAAVKSSVLELMRAQAHAQQGAGTLGVYLGNRDPGVAIDELRISIDGANQERYEYSDREVQALHRDGLHRFALLSPGPGKHHLRADFAARYTDSSPDHLRVAGRVDRDFETGAEPLYFELELVRGSYIGKPDLEFHQLSPAGEGPAAADAFASGSSADPRLRYAAFLADAERPLAALGELYAAQAGGVPQTADFQARMTQALAAFGLLRQAPPPEQSAPAPGGAALEQAYADYNKGVLLMQQGQEPQGAAILEVIAGGKPADEEGAALRDQANLVLGYAQLRAHTGANAVTMFSRVRSPGPCSNAALLGLGWALLAPSGNGQNAAPAQAAADAQTPFRRIPVMLQPQLTSDIATLKRREPYQLRQATPQEEQALRKALVPWTELIGRDPLDPAVQEGMIAIPYAMNHIGSYEEAGEYFQRAMRVLEAADAQLDLAMQKAGDGRMAQSLDVRETPGRGWPWWLAAYPREHWWLADDPRQPMAAPETFYLQRLMADDAFRSAAEDFHQLRLLDETLQHLDGGEALRVKLAAVTAAQSSLLRDLALAELRREKKHTEMYLGEARFALAHANEPALPAAKPSLPGARP